MKWGIRYYLAETAYKSCIVAFKEVINGSRDFASRWAQNKCKSSKFVAYDLIK